MIAVDAWKPADGLTLEPNALVAAKERVRSLALTAGPGAGKTGMLAQWADFLLRTGGELLISVNGCPADYQQRTTTPKKRLALAMPLGHVTPAPLSAVIYPEKSHTD